MTTYQVTVKPTPTVVVNARLGGPAGASGVTDYEELTNRPELADVATSGDYDDLTNKPEIASFSPSPFSQESQYETGEIVLWDQNLWRALQFVDYFQEVPGDEDESAYWELLTGGDGRLPDIGGQKVFVTNEGGEVYGITWTFGASGSTMAYRNSNGQLGVADPEDDEHAVPLGFMTAAITDAAAGPENLLPNPGFDDDLSDWEDFDEAWTHDAEFGRLSPGSAKAVVDGYAVLRAAVDVQPGKTYLMGAWVYPDSLASGLMGVQVFPWEGEDYGSALEMQGYNLSWSTRPTGDIPDQEWTLMFGQVTIPADVTIVAMDVGAYQVASGTLWVDDGVISEVITPAGSIADLGRTLEDIQALIETVATQAANAGTKSAIVGADQLLLIDSEQFGLLKRISFTDLVAAISAEMT